MAWDDWERPEVGGADRKSAGAAVNRALMNSSVHPDTIPDLLTAAKTEAGNSHDAGAGWQRASDAS